MIIGYEHTNASGVKSLIGRHHQRVAVRGRLQHRLRREIARAAGLVLDDDRLAEFLAQPGREQACNDVGRSAGRVADIDLDRLVGIRREDRRARSQQDRSDQLLHFHFPLNTGLRFSMKARRPSA
jgi:hypothetical protein